MKMILLRPYGIRKVGDVMNSVPHGRALQFIKNGVAIPADDPETPMKARGRAKKKNKEDR